ncbi:MAG: diguanylate cyclase, partial [Pseudomonadota bacterium]
MDKNNQKLAMQSNSDNSLHASNYAIALAQQFEDIGEIGYFVFDAVTERFLYVSDGFCRIYGVLPDQHMDDVKSLDDDLAFIVEEDRSRVHTAYQANLCRGVNCRVEYRIRRTDGEIRWLRESSSAQKINNGKVELTIGAVQDITELKSVETELDNARQRFESALIERTTQLANTVESLKIEVQEHEDMVSKLDFLANHDALTGLPSIRLFKNLLERVMAESRRTDKVSALMFVDLDSFKSINDEFGHDIGDEVLKLMADRLRTGIRETDVVARVGGD